MEIEILNPERLRYWCAQLDLPAAAAAELESIAQQVRADAALERVFSEFHTKTALRGEWPREWAPLPIDPVVAAALGPRSALFYLLAYLAAAPYTEAFYRRRGMDLAVMRATLADLRTWLVHEYELDGTWTFRQFMWVWRHLAGELFRLGRLQFMLVPFEFGVTALRRRSDGEICLLADPNLPLRADGYAQGAGHSHPGAPYHRPDQPPTPAEPGWLPPFHVTPAGWQGCPVSPYGHALPDSVFFPAAEWEVLLQPGDTVLELHIPRKDAFSAADCRAALAQAAEFFHTFFPERPYRAAVCHTWFFTPQLQRLLPASSNIVQFQREFSLFPLPGSPGFLWSYVFGEKVTSLAAAPRDTQLRRAVLDWLADGGELFDLAGVMFHDPQQWGSQPYMQKWDAQHPQP